jgi:hypothetical protein
MKTIKSALSGAKSIIDRNPDVLLFQLKEVIHEHRAVIIDRILSDVSTHVDYKFNVRADKNMMATVREKLPELKDACVELKKYDDVVHQVTTKQVAHLRNEPIYREINDQLSYVVKYQLKLM